MTDDTYADDSHDPVTNRSEIVFCYDAVDANPNGNPLSKGKSTADRSLRPSRRS